MKMKVYRVISIIGSKENIIFETEPFAENDGDADFDSYKKARRALDKHCMGLFAKGYTVMSDGSYRHIEKNINAGYIELILCTK